MKEFLVFPLVLVTAMAIPATAAKSESIFSIPSQDEFDKAGLVPSLGKSVRTLNLSIVECLEAHSKCNIEAANQKKASVKLYAAVFQCGMEVQICMATAQKTYAEDIAGVRY